MRAVMKKTTRRAPRPARVPSVPRTMRAAAIDAFGEPSALTIHTIPVPVPAANEVLIAVATAGVARWDADEREGWVPAGKPKFPLVLGSDGSGVVVATGSRIRRFEVGDEVYASAFLNPYQGKTGFYAEFVAVAAETVAPIPASLDLLHAGAVPITGLTALQGVEALELEEGEDVIVHGASGGVGTIAVQLARLQGARVFATASGADGVALVERLGADAAVDGKSGDLEEAARAFAPDGFDAALIYAGGEAQETLLGLVRKDGRAAYPNGVEPAPKKRRGLRLIAYNGEAGLRELEHLNRAIEKAKLEVPIAATFSLEEAAKAHEFLGGHVLGKVVLKVR